jgi:hydrogenase maturation protease
MADDGLGLAAMSLLQTRFDLPPEVSIVDGGTWGMNLLPTIEDSDRLLLIDAIDRREQPGTFIRLERDEIPRYLALKISPHQVDLSEVLALAELRGTLPVDTIALGLQPDVVEMRAYLSPVIEGALDGLVERVARQLVDWGHPVAPAEPALA